MPRSFDPEEQLYKLYEFNIPYDTEIEKFQNLVEYTEKLEPDNHSVTENKDETSDLEQLDLTFEEDELRKHFSQVGSGLSSEKDPPPSQVKQPPVLGTTLSQRKMLLKEHIEELKTDICKREHLQEKLLEKTDLQTMSTEHLLGTVKNFTLGSYPSVDMRRTHLERQITALENRSLDEQIRCWRDIVALKKELREALEEYHLICSAEGLSQAGD